MSRPLLLDEMITGAVAADLRGRRHDVVAVAADPSLWGLPDEELLAVAADSGRALVTVNVKDFVPLDQRYKASGRAHGGLALITAKSFPQDRSFVGAVVRALDQLLNDDVMDADEVIFLQRWAPLAERS